MKSKNVELRYSAIVLYYILYLIIFKYLENRPVDTIHIIHCSIDRLIPFCEWFIIPYFFWFAFAAIAAVVLFFADKETMFRMFWTCIAGMSIFLFVSYVFPNGLDIRPVTFARENVFVDMVRYLYRIDTSTNVLPSIHVYVSVCVTAAVFHSEVLNKKKILTAATLVTAVLIILSTMFLKQHSVVDVTLGLLLALVCCEVVYDEGAVRSVVMEGRQYIEKKANISPFKKRKLS